MNQQYQTLQLLHNFHVDFNKLALLDPSLRQHVLVLNDRVVWNFSTQRSLIALARAIMAHVFRLQWTCPPGNLCPRIPSRVNYLLWLSLQLPQTRRVLDVGTGATLIYPLLGWALFRWSFIAIETNQRSFECSRGLVEGNQLQAVIDLRLSRPIQGLQTILHPVVGEGEEVSVVVCNPPFFEEEAGTLSAMEGQEHHIEGGQYAFFFALYKDSFRYPRIEHFSCLLGRATDFQQIKAFLTEERGQGFLEMARFGEIAQGRNRRFIVLWRTARDG